MSRHGYSDDWDGDNWEVIRAAGAYKAAVRGKRGQAFLRELAAALDAMPVKELVDEVLEEDGAYCALGVLGAARGIDLSALDTYDHQLLATTFGVSETLARHVMYENDERSFWQPHMTEQQERERRWRRVRNWVESELTSAASQEPTHERARA